MQLHKLLYKRLRIPRQVGYPVLSAVKIASQPGHYWLRRRTAAQLSAAAQEAGVISRVAGYRLFGPEEYPGVRDVVEYCAKIYWHARKTSSADAFMNNPKKKFLLSILEGTDFCQHPDLIRFMVSRPILDAATVYLGSVPVLAGAKLWWSPVNETSRSSQRFHLDYEDVRQLKVFINIFETTPEQGPLSFIPADISDQIQQSMGRISRIIDRVSDAQVYAGGGRQQLLRLVGPPGSGAFVDTARCLHYGSRGNRRDRVVLMFQFLTQHAPYQSTARFQVPADLANRASLNTDPIQKLALRLR